MIKDGLLKWRQIEHHLFAKVSQSICIYQADVDKWDLMMLHWKAWDLGIKSLYYCRSKSIQRASYAGVEGDNTKSWPEKKFNRIKNRLRRMLIMSVKGRKNNG